MQIQLERVDGVFIWTRIGPEVLVPMTRLIDGVLPQHGQLCLALDTDTDDSVLAAIRQMYPQAEVTFMDR